MKFMLTDNEIWTRQNFPAFVVFVLKALFFVYSSNQKAFNNFWFQYMIDPPPSQVFSEFGNPTVIGRYCG